MKKKRFAGSSHYTESLGLKPILVYVDQKNHARLMAKAKRESVSLQKISRSALERFAKEK